MNKEDFAYCTIQVFKCSVRKRIINVNLPVTTAVQYRWYHCSPVFPLQARRKSLHNPPRQTQPCNAGYWLLLNAILDANATI